LLSPVKVTACDVDQLSGVKLIEVEPSVAMLVLSIVIGTVTTSLG